MFRILILLIGFGIIFWHFDVWEMAHSEMVGRWHFEVTETDGTKRRAVSGWGAPVASWVPQAPGAKLKRGTYTEPAPGHSGEGVVSHQSDRSAGQLAAFFFETLREAGFVVMTLAPEELAASRWDLWLKAYHPATDRFLEIRSREKDGHQVILTTYYDSASLADKMALPSGTPESNTEPPSHL